MQAVILAGGKGTRLLPFTATVPKAMVPLKGKPMLEILIEQLKNVGVTEIVVVVHYLKEKIFEHFRDGKDFGVKIKYALQSELKGSAHALLQARQFIHDDQFLVVACDCLCKTSHFRKLLAAPGNVVTGKSVEDPTKHGMLIVEGNQVLHVIEKPQLPLSKIANGSISLFSQDIFDACEQTIVHENGEQYLTDAVQLLIDKGKIVEFEFCDFIIDIGTPKQFAQAQDMVAAISD